MGLGARAMSGTYSRGEKSVVDSKRTCHFASLAGAIFMSKRLTEKIFVIQSLLQTNRQNIQLIRIDYERGSLPKSKHQQLRH